MLLAINIWNQDRLQKSTADEINAQIRQDRIDSQAEIHEKEENDSFYQKIADGFDVNILIVGDSIGAGAMAEPSEGWAELLRKKLIRNYGINVGMTNVSMGGNTSYAGYARTISLNDGIDYDLAILCYGENDTKEGFSLYYESIIRTVRNKYPGCSIISILESSQREYTEKIRMIQQLADHYGYPTVDTITPFAENYNELSDDGVHPNREGYKIYFDEVFDLISEAVDGYKGNDPDNISPLNVDVTRFDACSYVTVGEFERVDDLTYSAALSSSGIMGIDYDLRLSDNKEVKVYVDSELFSTLTYPFEQRHIIIVSGDCEVKNEVRVVFDDKKAADGFYGLYFSGPGST